MEEHQNVIVTDADHFANVSPWEFILGGRQGLEIRRLRINDQGQMDLDHLRSLVDENTRIVATTYAANAVGTVMPIRQIADIVHAYRDDSGNGAFLLADEVYSGAERLTDTQTPSFWGRYDKVLPMNLGPHLLPFVLYIAIAPAVVGFVSCKEGVRRLGSSGAMIFMNTLPLYGALFGYLLLNEPIGPTHLVGGALIIGGGVWAARAG